MGGLSYNLAVDHVADLVQNLISHYSIVAFIRFSNVVALQRSGIGFGFGCESQLFVMVAIWGLVVTIR